MSKSTISGTKDWNKYVMNNNAWNTTDYPMKDGVQNEQVYQSVPYQNPINTPINGYLNEGDTVRLVTKSRTKGYRASDYVNIKSGSLSGYIRVTQISKPNARNVSDAETRTLEITKQKLDAMIWASGIGKGSRAGCTIEIPGLGYFDEITDVDKVTNTRLGREVKADFYLKNSYGVKKLYISHKDGSRASDFGQYGGISAKSGTPEDPLLINQDPEVISFTDELYKYYADAIGPRQIPNNPFNKNGRLTKGVYRYITGTELIGRAVYGPEFGGAFGPENVHCLAQGSFDFDSFTTDDGDLTFRLNMSGHLNINPDISFFQATNPSENTGYRAAIITTFRDKRNTVTNQGTVPNTRTGIYPFAYRPSAMAI